MESSKYLRVVKNQHRF